MKYIKAQDVIPDNIIKIIQKYADGTYIYIPRKEENKKSWGEESGYSKSLEFRNREIYEKHCNGSTISELSMLYFLSESSIRRIIRIYK